MNNNMVRVHLDRLSELVRQHKVEDRQFAAKQIIRNFNSDIAHKRRWLSNQHAIDVARLSRKSHSKHSYIQYKLRKLNESFPSPE